MKQLSLILALSSFVLSGCIVQDPAFEVGSRDFEFNHFAGSMHLLKNKPSGQHDIVVNDIHRYNKVNELVYITGEYVRSDRENEREYYDVSTDSYKEWSDEQEVPYYLILDLSSGIIDSYTALDELSTGHRHNFEKRLSGFLCEFTTDCFKR